MITSLHLFDRRSRFDTHSRIRIPDQGGTMRPIHAIQIFVLSIGLIACAGHPSDQRAAAPAPTSTSGDSAASADLASATPDVVCRFPQRQCFDCRGNVICAQRCPECAPPVAPTSPDALQLADLKPVGEACGPIVCAPGLHCCNPTCARCTPKGVECTQQTCN
jgi:hypothetical protein